MDECEMYELDLLRADDEGMVDLRDFPLLEGEVLMCEFAGEDVLWVEGEDAPRA